MAGINYTCPNCGAKKRIEIDVIDKLRAENVDLKNRLALARAECERTHGGNNAGIDDVFRAMGR